MMVLRSKLAFSGVNARGPKIIVHFFYSKMKNLSWVFNLYISIQLLDKNMFTI
jgi:hypothetical protein